MKVEKKYNLNEIINMLNMLNITQHDNNILTKYDNQIISNTTISNKYKFFNFSDFAKTIVNNIENYFTPEKYILNISKGQQELRLIGESIIINGDKYNKMFNIFNSTDKSRALGINTGIIRYVCSNGMVIGIDNDMSTLKVKHFKKLLSNKVEIFIKSLEQFNINIQKQAEKIEKLNNNYVSFKTIAEKLIVDKDGIISINKLMKLKLFANKILKSETDKIENLTKEQIKLLKNPHLINNYKNVDIKIPSYTALNCYTEIFRNYNSQILSRETNRILELI